MRDGRTKHTSLYPTIPTTRPPPIESKDKDGFTHELIYPPGRILVEDQEIVGVIIGNTIQVLFHLVVVSELQLFFLFPFIFSFGFKIRLTKERHLISLLSRIPTVSAGW